MLTTEMLECPQCGGPVRMDERECSYCHSPILVKRVQDLDKKRPMEINKYIKAYQNFLKNHEGKSPEVFTAMGICHLKNGMYDQAVNALEKAVSLLSEEGDSYFYLAVAKMKGKRPYLQTLSTIKSVVQCLETALSIEPCGRYYYLLYLIQKDFYEKKRLRNGKKSEDLCQQALLQEVDDEVMLLCQTYCGLV